MKPVVLDASAGIKLFRNEAGSDQARSLLQRHGSGSVTICVPGLFIYEFCGVAQRLIGLAEAHRLYDSLISWQFDIFEINAALAGETWRQCALLDCSFYDGAAPALAHLLEAPLYSADRKAHSKYPGAVLLG